MRYIGITHYTSSSHAEVESILRKEKFHSCSQLLDRRPRGRATSVFAAIEQGVAVLVNIPFGGGGLLRKLRDKPLPALSGWHRLHESGAGAVEVRAEPTGGNLRHSRQRRAAAHGCERRRGSWTQCGCALLA